MTKVQELEKKHGTYREFEDAVWNTLGETSVSECIAACDSYREDLAKARLADMTAAGYVHPALAYDFVRGGK